MIEAKNLTKYYGEKLGVENVSFTIGDGEIVGLLGPNGAGKSTLMKMLTGYHMPTSGELYIDGVDAIASPKEAMSRIGFLPEIPPLYVDMTVADFLTFCAHIDGVSKKEAAAKVDEVMDTASITDVKNRLIRHLSKGYRQRVGLAQALIGDPDILIMDEPTVGLDPKQMAEFRELMIALSHNHTIILSSHILSEVNQVCQKLIIFNRGHVVAQDTAANLEQGLRSGDRFHVKLRADAERAAQVIRAVEGVRIVADRSDAVSDPGCCYLSVEGEGEGLRERMFRALAAADLPILELSSDRLTLEQVFLDLTGDGAEGEAAQ